jgi:tetratricopeptide (TPR) repeat protein
LRAEKESEALVAYRNALKFDKSQYPIWNQVLIMEYQQGNYEDLYTDSKECLTLFPTISTVYLLHGVSANQMKRHDEALETLSIGIELILNDLSLTAEYEGQLGEAYFGLKDVSNGKKHYDKALELDPKSTLLKNNYAYRLASSKIDLNKAEMIVIQAIKGSPKQAQFHDTYGWVLFQKGEYKNALEQFERASTFDASDAVIIEHIGDAAIMLDRTEKAIEMWEKAKALHSTSKTIDLKIQHKKYYEPNN